MNVLLVDDQKAILDSLKNGIHWDQLPVRELHTAGSAREAKLILINYDIDLLITDIEMPEEDGLSLFSWAKERFENMEGVFLTSHAEFSYAKEGLRMGAFDYILQPVRYADVEQVIHRVYEKIVGQRSIRRIVDTQKLVLEQKSTILSAAISNLYQGKKEEAEKISRDYLRIIDLPIRQVQILLIRVQRWKRILNIWEDSLVNMTLRNIVSEVFSMPEEDLACTAISQDVYWMIIPVKKEIHEELRREYLWEFADFVNTHLDFAISVYPDASGNEAGFSDRAGELLERDRLNTAKTEGILWETPEASPSDSEEDIITTAIGYIRKKLSKSVTRGEVAECVHLNEEYFSRLFRKKTGDTFKEFVTAEKMRQAEKLLEQTRLSVSIIASKVGYDNFSHFSQTFRKYTGKTPQEYRKKDQ